MIEYSYRGFNLAYEVRCLGRDLYKAKGKVEKEEIKQRRGAAKNFYTEFPTKIGAEQEIKKLLEDYVNFEWMEFYAMQ